MNQPQCPEFSQVIMEEEPISSNFGPKVHPSHKKTLVLCFDGTGNKFHGDSCDSNILKIFRMLDRSSGLGFHYYQPGIGTYVTTASLSIGGRIERFKNWVRKTKDTAIGTSFDQHVVGGYKFLMQYYLPGDDIYMFGFSRGAYTARFLAEMLDWTGLITFGNDEMVQFAWRTFSEWKQLDSSQTPNGLKKRKDAYDFLVSFRETFSRPVKRIRFLGLFDTVNSVPRFEHAMMRNHLRMPFSATSSAKIIRHAVSIDERRAKFRSDLIAPDARHKKETDAARAKHMREKAERRQHRHDHHEWLHEPNRFRRASMAQKGAAAGTTESRTVKVPSQDVSPDTVIEHNRFRRASLAPKGAIERKEVPTKDTNRRESEPDRLGMASASRFRTRSRSRSPGPSVNHSYREQSPDGRSFDISAILSDDESDGDEDEQDIEELWFSGGHGDIGGGWRLREGEIPLAHLPLAWIVREARKSGLQFDEEKMRSMGCWDDSEERRREASVPKIEVSGSGEQLGKTETRMAFADRISHCATKSVAHDCLTLGQGLSVLSVISWRIMEWIPFKRMDLRDDGSWKPIRWPLPRGEVRDMPDEAKVHHSAIKRMEADPNYRPGNLILGGGGRGVKKAPAHAGIGEWVLAAREGDLLGECYVRKNKTMGRKSAMNGQTTLAFEAKASMRG